jgi:hypothetical protein
MESAPAACRPGMNFSQSKAASSIRSTAFPVAVENEKKCASAFGTPLTLLHIGQHDETREGGRKKNFSERDGIFRKVLTKSNF